MNPYNYRIFPLPGSAPLFYVKVVREEGIYGGTAQMVSTKTLCKPKQDPDLIPCIKPIDFFINNNPLITLISESGNILYNLSGTVPVFTFKEKSIDGNFNVREPSVTLIDNQDGSRISFRGNIGQDQATMNPVFIQDLAFNFGSVSERTLETPCLSQTKTYQGGGPIVTNPYFEGYTSLLYVYVNTGTDDFYSGFIITSDFKYPTQVNRKIIKAEGNLDLISRWDNSGTNYLGITGGDSRTWNSPYISITSVSISEKDPFTRSGTTENGLVDLTEYISEPNSSALIYLEAVGDFSKYGMKVKYGWRGYITISSLSQSSFWIDDLKTDSVSYLKVKPYRDPTTGRIYVNFVATVDLITVHDVTINNVSYNLKHCSLVPPIEYNHLEITDIYTLLLYGGSLNFTAGKDELIKIDAPNVNSVIYQIIETITPAISSLMYVYHFYKDVVNTPKVLDDLLANDGLSILGGEPSDKFAVFQYTFNPYLPVNYVRMMPTQNKTNQNLEPVKETLTFPDELKQPFGMNLHISLIFYYGGPSLNLICQYFGYILSGINSPTQGVITDKFTVVTYTSEIPESIPPIL